MRNWNILPSVLLLHFHPTLPDYLWGIETSSPRRSSSRRSNASRLPMRNWNIISPSISYIPISCFQTTYEELKLTKASQTARENAASRLPMRNWNYNKFHATGGALGFQTTYEELKQSAGIWFSPWINASRLPMRNWNQEQVLSSYLLPRFQTTYEELKLALMISLKRHCILLPDYLWGIETRRRAICVNRARKLPDYLWGIETRRWYSRWCGIKGFQTTYEELKHAFWASVFGLLLKSFASKLPMRNWNNRS